MNRLEGAFAAVVVSSVLLGGIVAADASDSFRTVDLAGTVGSQADVEVTGTTIREDRLLVIAAVENPTRYRLELTGVFLQTFANESRLAYGSASFADPVVIPARSTERVRPTVWHGSVRQGPAPAASNCERDIASNSARRPSSSGVPTASKS